MIPSSVKHYFPVDPAAFPEPLLNGPGIIRTSDHGAMLAFAYGQLEERGFFQRKSPLDGPARPILTFPFVDYFRTLDLAEQSMLELGAGHSTLMFQDAFRRVRSYETDAAWQAALEPHLKEHARVMHCPVAALEAADIEYQAEEWLLIDFAGARTRFIHHFFGARARADMPKYVVLDNADWYRHGASLLTSSGYAEIPFFGLKPSQTWMSCTSLFVRTDVALPAVSARFVRPSFSRIVEHSGDTP